MAEGNKLLSKIFQPDLFCDDSLNKKGQLQLELKKYIDNFKVPYDSFIVYGKTVQTHQQQIDRIDSQIYKRSQDLQKLQLLLLKLQILQKCFLNMGAIIVTQELSTIDGMEELAFQMKTQSEIVASLLDTWSTDMKEFLKNFKFIFEKFYSLLS